MKRTLSLILLYALCLTPLMPAQAQTQVASIGELKEQIQKLLDVERDPSTPLDVKALNHTFLEERRAKLRTLIQTRVNALRKYQSSVKATLTDDENYVIENSIKGLESEVREIEKQMEGGAAVEASSVASAARQDVPAPKVVAVSDSGGNNLFSSTPSARSRTVERSNPTMAAAAAPAAVAPQAGTVKLTVRGHLTSTLEASQAASGGQAYSRTREARRSSTTTTGAKYTATTTTAAAGTPRQGTCSTGDYFRDCTVELKDSDGNLIATVQTEDDGAFEIIFNGSLDKTYVLSSRADDGNTKRNIKFTENSGQNNPYEIDLPIEDRPVSLLSRAVVGYEQVGASSTKSAQKYFFNLYLSKPVPWMGKINPDFGQRVRMWGDIRVTSVPQAGTANVATFVPGFAQQVGELRVNEIAQAIEFLAGVEVRITGNNSLLPSFDRQTKQKFSLSLVAAFGTTTPTNPRETIEVFRVFPDAPGLPPAARDREFVAFVSSDRDRFFRQYYAGLRFQTFYFNRYDRPMQRFPAMLDLTYGQNEFVTGGRLRGGVFRLDGYFPLPYEEMKFINLFGTAMLKAGRTKITDPLILQPAPADTVVPAANVAIITSPQINRDYYRAGVGIDFISFVQALKNSMKKKD
ncbi:MAG TPA: hypothetical protein VGV59_16060 [Pyrinomonadaceae bacterium]|nr:hypothetical protein [Pyrinomonadaceae bacterium]